MDCNGEEYLAHTACTPWTPTGARRPSVEEWTESAGPHPQGHRAEGSQDYLEGYLPIPEFEPSVLEARDQEEDGPHRLSKEGYQDYYPAEANENTGASPYCLRCGDGDLEDQEGDIDEIVAAIKMSLSMMSITSANEAGPEHGPEPGPGDSAEGLPALPAGPQQARGEGQVTVNLPSKAKHRGDPQRGFNPSTRTPEERPKWPHEQQSQRAF
ncbi:amyloid-beta A4 precursor protein-binding family A member 2-like [Aotus nancymaae]|uniref:amyloid-beta A4 precursor protein-binding family A member 2-like n=1 Tax=Aotus nancymaae TaxID=37293 RepID=UPI0030FE7068